MANEGLKARVAELRSQLNDIQRENARLQGEINAVVDSINDADRSLNSTAHSIRSHLNGGANTLGQAHQNVIHAYEVQQSMDELYRRMKQMELANKRIRECNNKKFYDFAVYRTVRKIVQGIMDDLDFSMVSGEVIDKAVERKQLENPDYWLTCVLVALVAWRADQRERAQRALGRAMKLDDRKTASFLMVFHLRLHREEVALKWFRYLTRTPLKGSEKPMMLLFFSMLSRTIEDRLSDSTRQTVVTYINKLVSEGIARDGQIHAQTVERIADAYAALAGMTPFPYDAINAHVPSHDGLTRSLTLARNVANIIDFIAEILTVDEDARNEFLKQYIDQIVAAPCAVEQEVYDEIERNECIIRAQGDVAAAQQAYAASKQHDSDDFDIIAEMMDWIYTQSGRNEANPQMRRNMFIATAQLQQEAGDLYIRRYRSTFTPAQHIVIDDFSIDGDLRDVQTNTQAARQFYEQRAATDKAAVKDVWAILTMVLGVAGGAALAVFVQPALAAVGAVALVVGGVRMLMNRATRKRIDLKYAQRIQSAAERLQALAADWQRLEQDFHAADMLSQTLMDKLGAL